MSKEEGNYVSVAGKVSTWCYGRLNHILHKKELNIYQMIQNVCDCFVRNMDDRHSLTPETEKIMAAFEGMAGWKDSYNLADCKARPEISEAVYFLTAEGRKGVRAVHVERPFFGRWTQNFNTQQILERFLCLTFPQLYRRLRYIATGRDCSSIYELLTEVAAELETEEDKKELHAGFEDDDRGDFGQHVHDRIRAKRQYNKSTDTLFKEDLI